MGVCATFEFPQGGPVICRSQEWDGHTGGQRMEGQPNSIIPHAMVSASSEA